MVSIRADPWEGPMQRRLLITTVALIASVVTVAPAQAATVGRPTITKISPSSGSCKGGVVDYVRGAWRKLLRAGAERGQLPEHHDLLRRRLGRRAALLPVTVDRPCDRTGVASGSSRDLT
jgi:hypothetical protein